jgi:hypothetical protein
LNTTRLLVLVIAIALVVAATVAKAHGILPAGMGDGGYW